LLRKKQRIYTNIPHIEVDTLKSYSPLRRRARGAGRLCEGLSLTCLSPPCGVCMEHQCKTGLPGLHEILVTAGSCFKQPCVLKRVGGTRID